MDITITLTPEEETLLELFVSIEGNESETSNEYLTRNCTKFVKGLLGDAAEKGRANSLAKMVKEYDLVDQVTQDKVLDALGFQRNGFEITKK